MQKKLLAVAVAGALGAPAVAMAQASTVQLYGKITAEYGYVDQGDGRPKTDMLQTPGGSAIGVKGEEKLGGGLSAWFQCESSADVRGVGQDGFCTRNSALGFKGGFGNIHIGRWDTPFKRATNVGMIGAGDTGLLGAAFLMAGNSTGTGATGGQGFSQNLSRNVWKRRESSQIYYESPSFSGFQVLASYSAANATRATDATTAAKPRVESLAAIYANGPLAVSAAYERHSDFGAVGSGNDDRGWTLNASYKFGGVKLAAAYIDTRYDVTSGHDLTKKNWMVGADWNISGPHNLEAAYIQAGDSKGSATAAEVSAAGLNSGNGALATPGSDTGAKMYQIAYRHDFSKRTSAKLAYVRLDNDNNASYSLGGLRAPVNAGNNQSAFVLYMQHSF